MKVIIAGSRTISDYMTVEKAIKDSGFNISMVVSGTARGVDRIGEQWASRNGIPIKPFPASWMKYGKRAGFKRNEEMAKYADALIAVWDGESPGSKHMLGIARMKGLKVFVRIVENATA